MDLLTGFTQVIIRMCLKCGCTLEQTAYILATTYHETNKTMRPVEEAYWLSEEWRRANLHYYPWHGRGFVQLTWERNYKRAQRETGILVHDTPSLAMGAVQSATILVLGSMGGWWTGKKIPDYINAKRCDYKKARRVINGNDDAALIAGYAERYAALLETAKLRFGGAARPTNKPAFTLKSLVKSKEIVLGATGVIATLSQTLDQLSSNTTIMILSAVIGAYVLNRLYARFRGDR